MPTSSAVKGRSEDELAWLCVPVVNGIQVGVFSPYHEKKPKHLCLASGLAGAAGVAGHGLGLRCSSGSVDGAGATSAFLRWDLE